MANPDDEMCVDYRYLGSYSIDPRIREAYENAPLEKRAILNRIEHLYHVKDDETFAHKAGSIQGRIAATEYEFDHVLRDEMLRDRAGTIGYIEGHATQMIMGKEEASVVMSEILRVDSGGNGA